MKNIPKLFPTQQEVDAVKARLEGMGCTAEDTGAHWIVRPQNREADKRLVAALAIDPCRLKKWGIYNVAYHEIHTLLTTEPQDE